MVTAYDSADRRLRARDGQASLIVISVHKALGGIATVLVALFAGLTLIPALLAHCANNLGRVPRQTADDGFFGRLAHRVQRRPLLVASGRPARRDYSSARPLEPHPRFLTFLIPALRPAYIKPWQSNAMETTPALVFSPGRRHVPLSQGDMALLESIGRFGLVTAEQLTRLHTPTPHGLRSMQRRLKRLVDAGLLLRLRAHPTPRYGSAPHVFSLANLGRVCLAQLGVPLPDYFRPGEEREKAANLLFLTHALSVVDVLISAACLARSVPEVSLTRLRTERELKHEPLRVAPDPTRPARTVAVIPDAWFQLVVSGVGTYSVALELDRGSEHRARWATKAAALAAWAVGPYKRGFDTDNLTIAIVAPTAARRDSLADWIGAELEDRNLSDLRGVFLITCADPASIPAEDLFFLPHWYQPGTSEPVRLMKQRPGPPQHVWDVAADSA